MEHNATAKTVYGNSGTSFDITRPGVYAVTSFGRNGWSPAFRAPLAGTYAIHGNADGVTGKLVRVAADPPIFPRMKLR